MEAAKQAIQKTYETKRYFSKVAGSKFIMPDGKELFFNHGFFDLKEEDYIDQVCTISVMNGNPVDRRDGKPCFKVYKDELDALIIAGNPLLYVQGSQPEQLPKIKDTRGREGTDANAFSESDVMVGDARMKNAGAKLTGDANNGTLPMTTGVNESTVDNELRNKILAESPAAIARREAAQRTAATTAGGTSSNS